MKVKRERAADEGEDKEMDRGSSSHLMRGRHTKRVLNSGG